MKLSSLEIKGFKSFADKTTLHFNESVTGVVGPNGCGKSNIVDAIRWVLGEQRSSNLRTERMENLVFNGTKARKSSGLAEVSLTFENTANILPTEFSTVTVSRHYFRTGESEYRLNNVPCRLKDITGLFLDTGISSDSYAIIELGMLNDLLHDKDNSRRKMFEQAAGISKYKVRKRQTLNKLKSTQDDLNRVEDLLFEIQNNLNELEKQARKARRYRKIKEDYRHLSIELAVHLLDSQKSAYGRISEQQEQEQDRRLALETKVQQAEAELEALKRGNLEHEKELSGLQGRLNEKLSEIRKQENDRNVLAERLRLLQERTETLERAIQEAEAGIKRNAAERDRLDKRAAAEQESVQHIQEQLEQLNRDLKKVKEIHQAAKEKLETARSAWQDTEAQLNDARKRFEINEVRIENAGRELERLDLEENEQQGQLALWTETAGTVAEEQEKARHSLQQAEAEQEALDRQVENKRTAIDQAAEQLAGATRELDARRNELRLTKSLVENLEGFPESIKYLKKHVEWTREAPLVSDIISCPDDHKQAIESYLEPWLNHYVVADLHAAAACIRDLADKKKGRAKFFILSELPDAPSAPADIPDGFIPALSVIETDQPYRGLADHLLGQVVLLAEDREVDAEDIDHDWLKTHRVNLISPSGKYVKTPYALAGGSVGTFRGKRIGRAKDLEKLSVEVDRLEKAEVKAREAVSKLREEAGELQTRRSRLHIKEAQQVLDATNRELHSAQARMDNLKQMLEGKGDRRGTLHTDIERLREENRALASEISELDNKRATQQTEVEKLSVEFQALNNQLGIATNNYNQQTIRFHQQENRVNTLTQELNFTVRQMEEASAQAERDQQTLTATSEEIGQIQSRLEELKASLDAAYTEKEADEKVIQQAEERYYHGRSEINEVEERLRNLQKNRDQVGVVLGDIKDRMNELKLQLNSIKERLLIEFSVDIEELLERDPDPAYDKDELNAKVERLKKRLDNYGEINPMAEQAYDEMKERSDFIESQRDDLIEARESLLETIREIDETARTKFMESFELVRENFIKTFRTLFRDEDDCDLVLIDPENPLESKIDIVAKPKGKKPQVIDQLSGGEKTLTAMALLFGLYLLKPAPFCILDEVDAPLDDNNITKFNDIIRRFSDKSQFIIVTHNKRTMSRVDTIYGVTMQEQGISKVVPVDFRQWN